jgi:Zn finger protein HypA/HybF involved in hydrogenase expression
MPDFCECQDCGFVVRAEGPTSPVPKRWDDCPNCGGDEFAFRDGAGFEFEFPDL